MLPKDGRPKRRRLSCSKRSRSACMVAFRTAALLQSSQAKTAGLKIGRASCRERVESSVVGVSSRRRHTRCSRDWSSDVCSSDLKGHLMTPDQIPSESSPWVDAAKGWAAEKAEALVQQAVKIGLHGRFPHCRIVAEQPGKDGRTEDRKSVV